MRNSKLSVSALMLLMLLGCASGNNDKDNGDSDASGGTGGDEETDSPGDTGESCDTGEDFCANVITEKDEDGNIYLPVTDAQNMYFRSELTIATETLKAGSDFTIDWSELSVDMLQQEIDPLNGVDRLQMVLWKLPEADLLVKLNNDDLAMADVELPGMVPTNNERTSVRYLEMESVAASPIDEERLLSFIDPEQYDPELYSYTVMTAVGTNPELGFKMLHLLRFSGDEEKTEVKITNESSILDYEVDIASSDPIPLPVDNPNIVVDWGADTLEANSLGNPFIPVKILHVTVAHYPDMNVCDLEENFLDIEYVAEDFYIAMVESGTRVNLNTLVDEEGDSFPGINRDGTWILALMCGDCANPAPWFLSILQPCDA